MAAKKSDQADELLEELEQFKVEQEKIRSVVGQIGGMKESQQDVVINIVFGVTILIVFFANDVLKLFGVDWNISRLVSIEVGLLLVSIKIIWMIHKQTKVEHFQFWILNSIEYRLNELSRDMRSLLKEKEGDAHAE